MLKNKYNALVAILALLCLADAGYRVYKIYHKLTDKQEEARQ